MVSEGFQLEFDSEPIQLCFPLEPVMSQAQWEICSKEVASMMEKGAITLCDGRGFVSTMFAVPNNSGGWRPIINLKQLNKHLVYRHFKMEGAYTVRDLVIKGDWMVKLDLKDAYFTVPVHPDHHQYLQFVLDGVVYQYCCLPFGLSSAPWAFTKLLRPVVAFLRSMGVRLVIYLDDLLILNESYEDLREQLILIRSLLSNLGFVVNVEKSVFNPTQLMEFLGLIVDSMNLTFALPAAKIASIVARCREALRRPQIRLRDLASLLGSLVFAITSVPYAQSHYRSIQFLYLRLLMVTLI